MKKVLAFFGLTVISTAAAFAGGGGGLWLSFGHDHSNARHQKTETKIGPDNVGDLAVNWALTTGADVSATPAVDGKHVYFPDWAGNLYKVDRKTGEVIWSKQISDYNGIPGSIARATPAVYGNMLIFGDQGGRNFSSGASVMAVDKDSGDLLWISSVGNHPMAIVTQSASVFAGVVYVGVASLEEAAPAFLPGYECCTFRGSMLALDAFTGEIIWETYTVPGLEGYSGNAVWGSSPVIDHKRGSVYVATGNNYSVPDATLQCIAAAGDDTDAQRACLPADNLYDAIVAFDMMTGAIKWSTVVIPFDVWDLSCLFGLPSCPDPAGPDFDFGQAPILYRAEVGGKMRDLLGVGQKSGQFWSLDAETGAIIWSTQVGPGGEIGGIMWGSAYDGDRLYAAISNSQGQNWDLVGGGSTSGGGWSALDPATGEILWQTANPTFFPAMGAVTVANDVVYGCSTDVNGHMYAMDAASGQILWDFTSGGSCNAGAAVVNGTVYWGSGYSALGPPFTGSNIFYAFSAD